VPAEFDDNTPFDADEHHASYDVHAVESFQKALVQADHVLKKFRSRFIGKSSPVHFFWGSFDLAVTRFSGREAPVNPEADSITREGYSHEVSSCGFWPGDRKFPHAAFYAYAAPSPAGFAETPIQPGYWNAQAGYFVLEYEEVRKSSSPHDTVLNFCQSTYEAAANLAKWDRAALERK
jgi:hypothetical protein